MDDLTYWLIVAVFVGVLALDTLQRRRLARWRRKQEAFNAGILQALVNNSESHDSLLRCIRQLGHRGQE